MNIYLPAEDSIYRKTIELKVLCVINTNTIKILLYRSSSILLLYSFSL